MGNLQQRGPTELRPNASCSNHQVCRSLERAQSSRQTVFVDFTATWCGPCQFIGPYFAELATENEDAIFVKVDVDEMASIAEECKVSAMPTFKAYKKGEQVGELVGANKEKLAALVKTYKAG